MYTIPSERLDLRPDAEVDRVLMQHRPVTDDKNIWFYWHDGYENMYPTAQRTVRAYHRRFSKLGWKVRQRCIVALYSKVCLWQGRATQA